jgi:hypothetical protein
MRATIIGLTVATLTACSPQPRSASYFEAHQQEATKVVADCAAGSHRGQECANAQAAVAAAERDARIGAYRTGF